MVNAQLQIASIRWAVGIFLALIGAMMLVTPHQFSSQVYATLQPQLALWGVAFLLAGIGLLALESGEPARPVVIGTHLVAGAELLILSYVIALVGGWTATSNFGVLGLGTAAAPFLPRPQERQASGHAIDLFSLVIGLAAAMTGLTILAFPQQFSGPIYDVIRPYLPGFGVAFLVGGLALAYVEVRPTLPRPVYRGGHLLAGGALLAFFVASAIPLRAWIGIAYYGGFGLLIALLPWLKTRLRDVDPTSLQSRLALALALAVSIPLILIVAVVMAETAAAAEAGDPTGLNQARDLSLLILLAFIAVAVVAGIWAGRLLTAPLNALARAADGLAAGDVTAQLPQSEVGEVAHLAGAFGEMRDRLVARTAEREQLVSRLQETNARLDAANKELESFSYSVSHDLRAPLRHIDGFSEILLNSYADRLDEQGRQYLRFLREGSQRMDQLIGALLKLSRLTRAEMRRQAVDLSEMARSILAELQKEQPERQVETTVVPGVVATGDPQLLRVALENLLGNAWKFTSKRPVAKIEFGVTRQEGKPVYYVRDSGAGFDPSYADRLFAPFQRLHRAEEFPGTGIGLATVQRIVHRHGGRVWAKGEVDKGATFCFTLG